MEGIHRLLIVEADAALLRVACRHARHVEGRMAADLEVDLAGVGIVDMPYHAYLVVVEHVTDAQGEVVGIHLPGRLGGFEGEGNLPLALGDEPELGIAGKAMPRQVVLLAIHTISLVVHAAHDRKEDRRMARPIPRVGLPKIFLAMGVLDALQLCSFLRYSNR